MKPRIYPIAALAGALLVSGCGRPSAPAQDDGAVPAGAVPAAPDVRPGTEPARTLPVAPGREPGAEGAFPAVDTLADTAAAAPNRSVSPRQ